MSKILSKINEAAIGADQIKSIMHGNERGACRAVLHPDAARVLLANHNSRNRGIKKKQRDFLKKQMMEGKFRYNGEAIIVGDDGNILNGQHRLSACVDSGVAIEVLMVFGIESERFTTIDQGARRIKADVLSIEGYKNCNLLAATLKQVDQYYSGTIGRSGHAYTENSLALDLIKKYPDVEESLDKVSGIVLTKKSLAAALHYVFSQLNQDDADEFVSVVVDGVKPGVDYTSVGEAAAMLSQWLTRASIGPKRMPAHYIANIWLKAWNAGRTGNLPRVLIYRESEGSIKAI